MLTFEVDPLVTELREVFSKATDFFDTTASTILKAAAKDLETAFRVSKGKFSWEVRQGPRAICTRPSDGKFEPSGGGRQTVVGTCSWLWELKKVDSKFVAIAGNASLKVALLEVIEENGEDVRSPLCEWNFDIGEAGHPGTLVHTQLCSVNQGSHLLSVPRFPSVVLAPTDALDFLLGELFQEDWAKEANLIRSKHQKVAKRMRTRLATFLEQQALDLREAPGLAVHALKAWQPSASLRL